MAVFELQQHKWRIGTETLWPTKPAIVTHWPFKKKNFGWSDVPPDTAWIILNKLQPCLRVASFSSFSPEVTESCKREQEHQWGLDRRYTNFWQVWLLGLRGIHSKPLLWSWSGCFSTEFNGRWRHPEGTLHSLHEKLGPPIPSGMESANLQPAFEGATETLLFSLATFFSLLFAPEL